MKSKWVQRSLLECKFTYCKGHQFTRCTAAMLGIFSLSFWVTATRTVMTLAAGPVMRTLTTGVASSTSSRPPPEAPTKYGLQAGGSHVCQARA